MPLQDFQPVIRISSSLANWRNKLLERTRLREAKWYEFDKPTLFVGLYHFVDYLKLVLHRGRRRVFWAGADITNLQDHYFYQWVLRCIAAKHYCESAVEQQELSFMGIKADLLPMIFTNFYPKTSELFKPSDTPDVFLTAHPGREKE